MISHLRNIFLLLITCFLALIIFLPTPALARGQCTTTAQNILADGDGSGSGPESWSDRVFHDPNNNRWHVYLKNAGTVIQSYSTADNSCSTWTAGVTIANADITYDQVRCALDVNGGSTYLHCAYALDTYQLFYVPCTLSPTTPFISCGAPQTVITTDDAADDFKAVAIAVDSNHCVLIAADWEDDSIATAADEHQVSFFKEAATCGDLTWGTAATFPKDAQSDAGYAGQVGVGMDSYGDLDAQVFWIDTDTSGTYQLKTNHFDGDTNAFGTQRTLDADIEGGSTWLGNSSVVFGTKNVTLGLDDLTTDLDAYIITTKDGALGSQVDTVINSPDGIYNESTAIVVDTVASGGDNLWAFSVDNTDTGDIVYNTSTDGGATWGGSATLWSDDEIFTTSKYTISAGFNKENCDILVTWASSVGDNVTTKVINTGSCSITVSGVLYSDEGTTEETSTVTVSAVVGGDSLTKKSAFFLTNTPPWDPYSISLVVDESTSETIHVYSETAGYLANTVTRTNLRNNITDLDLYENHVIVRHEDAGPLTATNMLAWHNDAGDTDMLYNTGFGGLGMESGSELYVTSGKTLSVSGAAFIAVDDLDVNGTLNMGGLLLQAQGGTTSAWDFTTGTLTSGGPLTVNGNSLTLTSNAATFTNLTIGANASLTTNDNLDLNGNISITNGTGETINITGDTLNVAGNMNLSNLDTFTVTTSTVIFDGTTTLTSNSKSFNNVQIGSASAAGSLTTADTMDINGTLSVNNGGATTWNISDDTITAASTVNLTNLDTFTVAGSTVRFDGAALQTVTSASKTYGALEVTNASGAGVSFADPWTAGSFTDTTVSSKLTFNAGSTYTITGGFTLTGALGSLITVTSSGTFYFDVPSCKGVKYVTVTNSEVTGTAGNDIKAIDSDSSGTGTDSGGATPKWFFNSGSCAKKGAVMVVD